MPNTKIINVLRNDSFDEVFNEFVNCEAQEVIFIFPKGSRFIRNEGYFEMIRNEADSLGKVVSVMTADPIIATFAAKFDLNLLENSGGRKPRKAASVEEDGVEEIKAPDTSDTLTDPEEPESDQELMPSYINAPPKQAHDFRESSNADVELASVDYDEDGSEDDPHASLAGVARRGGAGNHAPVRAGTSRPMRDIVNEVPPSSRRQSIPVTQEAEEDEALFVTSQKQFKSAKRSSAVEDISNIWMSQEEDGKRASHREKISSEPSRRFFQKKLPLIFIGLAILVTMLTFYTILGSARITLKPQQQNINFDIKVSASSDTATVDTEFNRIPGQKFSQKDEVSEIFPATGQKDIAQKASGTITIYNKGSSSQRLVATTRFESPEGLIFRINSSVNVPGATGSVPGSVKATIFADRPGPEYNIKPTTFTIPGFKDTPKFADFSAKNDKAISGGANGPSKIVTADDYSKALDSLTAKLKEKIKANLADQAKGLTIIDATSITIGEPTSNVNTDGAADNLNMTLSGSAETIAFRDSDITAIIKNYISKNSELLPIDSTLKIDYQNPILSTDKSTLTFSLKVSGQAAVALDKDKILQDILGMPESKLQDYFKSNKSIESAKIMLSPFWLRSIPSDKDKVTIVIEIEPKP